MYVVHSLAYGIMKYLLSFNCFSFEKLNARSAYLSARSALTESRIDSGEIRRDNGNFSLSGVRNAQDLKLTKCQRDLDCEVQGVHNKISSEEISEYKVAKSKVYLYCLSRGRYKSEYSSFGEEYMWEEGVAQHEKLSKFEEWSES
jgi:hypothetical protein